MAEPKVATKQDLMNLVLDTLVTDRELRSNLGAFRNAELQLDGAAAPTSVEESEALAGAARAKGNAREDITKRLSQLLGTDDPTRINEWMERVMKHPVAQEVAESKRVSLTAGQNLVVKRNEENLPLLELLAKVAAQDEKVAGAAQKYKGAMELLEGFEATRKRNKAAGIDLPNNAELEQKLRKNPDAAWNDIDAAVGKRIPALNPESRKSMLEDVRQAAPAKPPSEKDKKIEDMLKQLHDRFEKLDEKLKERDKETPRYEGRGSDVAMSNNQESEPVAPKTPLNKGGAAFIS